MTCSSRVMIETIVKESPVLQTLPFIEVVGNGLTYNQENGAPTASFFNPGDTWTESSPTFTQVTATLKILGGDADIDNFARATRSNLQDLEAAVVQLKAKALRTKFEETFIGGDSSTDAKSFDGVDKLAVTGQTASMGANGGTLTLGKLDEMIDLVKEGKPHILLMSRRSRRKLTALSRAAGSGLVVADRNEFGQMTEYYDGVPVAVNDYIPDDKRVGSASDCFHDLRPAAGRGRRGGAVGAGRAHGGARGEPGEQGRDADPGEVVCGHRRLQRPQAGEAGRRPGLGSLRDGLWAWVEYCVGTGDRR